MTTRRGRGIGNERENKQQKEEHGVMESKWRKTGGVMIPAIALADWRVGCPTG